VRFRASDVAAATGGRLLGDDVEIDGASFDSRTLRPGQLFVALVAERDGHDFIPAAVAAGASASLKQVERDLPSSSAAAAIVVPDTAAALMALGAWARGRLPERVAGITGSVGKTSAKDFAAAILRTRWRTASNVRSYNNEQGLPITLLEAPDDTEVAVLEMGMRGPGQIAELCEVGRPTLGVVTAVAEAHTELLGSLAAVAQAKGELIEALPSTGVAVLNIDQPLVAAMAARTSARVLTFGTAGADIVIRGLTLDAEACARFTIDTPWGSAPIALAVPGAHMALNAAAALAVGLVWDVSLPDAAGAVEKANLSQWRMELHHLASGAVLLNDAYNANPASMRAALDTLAALSAHRRRALLGIMAELDDPASEHAVITAYARDRGIEVLAVGTDLYDVPPVDDPVAALGPLGEGDAVLVKASRVAGLEKLAARLVGDRAPDA
jgi:UDP-N-acetylmuramoyl-tripeptide--D-alanyl-D-alanine ligase